MEKIFLTLVQRVFYVTVLAVIVSILLLTYIILKLIGLELITIGSFCFELNENYYSGLITIVVSLFVLALPLAINAITANQDKRFANNELGDSFYKNRGYKFIKGSSWILLVVMLLSYFKKTTLYIDIPVGLVVIFLIYKFVQFLKVVEQYVGDFPKLLIDEEKKRIDEMIND